MEWYVRIIEKRRREINVDLLVQAVIALRDQFEAELVRTRAESEESEEDAR